MIKYVKVFLGCSKYLIVVLVAATIFFGTRVAQLRFDFSMESLFATGSRERRDYDWFRGNFGSDDAVVFVGFKAPDVLSEPMRNYAGHLAGRLAKIPGVRGVFSVKDAVDFYRGYVKDDRFITDEIRTNPLFRGNVISEDGRTTCLWVLFAPEVRSEEQRAAVLEKVRGILGEEERASGLRFHSAGIPVIEHEYARMTRRDLMTFMPLAVSVFLLLLCFYFRNVMGTFLPLASVGMGVVWTMGLMQVCGLKISILSSIIPSMILVVGIADAVHILSHYREMAHEHPDKKEALARTILAMVPATFLVATTTSVGFASLATTDIYIINEFGVVTALGIMVGWLITIHFMPAALDNLPPFRGRVMDNFAHQFSDRLMERIGRINERHKKWIAVGTLAVVGLAVAGIFRIKRESSWLQDVRRDNAVYQAHAFFEQNLSPVITVDLILRADRPGAMKELDRLRKAEELQAYVREWKHPSRPDVRVTQTLSYTDLLKEVNRARQIKKRFDAGDLLGAYALAKNPAIRKLPENDAELEECRALYEGFLRNDDSLSTRLTDREFTSSRISVRISNVNNVTLQDFMGDVGREHAKYAGSFRLMPTGKSWLAKQAMDSVVANMISSTWVAAAIIFGSMMLLFRSFKVGLISIVPNMLPMVTTAGIMGWGGIPLNFTSITIFSIVLGIAVDTTIHYLARLRLEVAADGDHVQAMHRTLRGAGRAMIFSTLLLVLGFGSILTSSFKFTFYFGVLGGAGLLVALVCDLFVTPALMLHFKPAVGKWTALESKFKDLDRRLTEMLEKRECK